jgi:phosphoenolpyruvate carboxykinase (ATP)
MLHLLRFSGNNTSVLSRLSSLFPRFMASRSEKIIEQLHEVGVASASSTVHHNISFETLFEHEMDPSLTGFDRGFLTSLGAVSVDTGEFTGRSPKDKYVVRESTSEGNVWWHGTGSDNKPITSEVWGVLKSKAADRLSGRPILYVQDGFCGARDKEGSRLKIRVVTETAWLAHFTKNMFIRPTEEELEDFVPDWTILHGGKIEFADHAKYGLNSATYAAFHIGEKMTVIGNTWYGGEIKKGIFSMMNYFLPVAGIGAFHCSANVGKHGEGSALFFGLSGTGKTTLSADPKRLLLGDDEHGWDDEGIFNFEGGCYAKCINLAKETEPDIFNAITRDALLENVVIDPKTGDVDFCSNEKTENTRVSYPLYHIENIVTPPSVAEHPKTVIFLTCDAFGVLPPVSRLTPEQAQYQFLSGYTAKVAGTERGVNEPTATFSSCFGGPFLSVHPTKYATILAEKMKKHNCKAYLVNTGWSGGSYGVGKRMNLGLTRKIIDAVLDGTIDQSKFEEFSIFSLPIPTSIAGFTKAENERLNPRATWTKTAEYDKTIAHLAVLFKKNFVKFTDTDAGKALVSAGPKA